MVEAMLLTATLLASLLVGYGYGFEHGQASVQVSAVPDPDGPDDEPPASMVTPRGLLRERPQWLTDVEARPLVLRARPAAGDGEAGSNVVPMRRREVAS